MCVRFSVEIPRGLRGKPVAVAEGREGGPTTLDLTKWDFNKADCRTRYRKLIGNSKPPLLIGSLIDAGGEDEEQTNSGGSAPGIHLRIIRSTSARGTVFSSHTFALRKELGPANSCGFHEQVPRHVPDSD